jgi:hypothetical protein
LAFPKVAEPIVTQLCAFKDSRELLADLFDMCMCDLMQHESHEAIEREIDCGQVEELIIQAKAELTLAEKV